MLQNYIQSIPKVVKPPPLQKMPNLIFPGPTPLYWAPIYAVKNTHLETFNPNQRPEDLFRPKDIWCFCWPKSLFVYIKNMHDLLLQKVDTYNAAYIDIYACICCIKSIFLDSIH